MSELVMLVLSISSGRMWQAPTHDIVPFACGEHLAYLRQKFRKWLSPITLAQFSSRLIDHGFEYSRKVN